MRYPDDYDTSKLILEVLSELDVKHIFTFPSKKIDPVLEKVCANSAIEVIICTSESSVIDSAIGYAAFSNKVPAVLIDATFIPPEFFSSVLRAKALGLMVLFLFAEPLPKFILSVLKSLGQSVETLGTKPISTELPSSKPRVLAVDPKNLPSKAINHEKQLLDSSTITSLPDLEYNTNHLSSSLVASLIQEVLLCSPNSILLPDAGAPHKVSRAFFADKMNGTLNVPNYLSMGHSLRSVRGIFSAVADRLSVIIIGDGSMLIQGNDIAWLVHARIPCLILLCINGQLGNRNTQTYAGKGSKLPNVDWEQYIKSLGAKCTPVQSIVDRKTISECVSSTLVERLPIVIPIDITGETDFIYKLTTGISFLDNPNI